MIHESIFATSIPKSGLHAMHKLTYLLGRTVKFGHIPYKPEGTFKTIFMTRNPREIAASWLRFTKIEPTEEAIISQFATPIIDRTLVEWHADMAGWLTDKDTLRVRFEDLDKEKTAVDVASFIDVPYKAGMIEKLPGGTASWSPVHAKWEEFWTPAMDTAWKKIGGPDLEKAFGY